VHDFIGKNKISDISYLHESEIEEKRKSLVQTIGENIQLRRLITKDFSSDMNAGSYIHSDSKLGAVVIISGGDESLAKDIAMHVAAFNPLCLSESDLDSEILEREKAIYLVQAEDSGKPKEIMEKMIEGKLKRFLSEVSLLSQDFVKDPEISIQELLDSKNAKIESYSRLKVGEGIEVESKSFADEVAEQLK
jgi:elongation factor Ts